MHVNTTLMWRLAVLGLLATAVPVGIYSYERHNQVDTESMLDVSVSVRTISHVRIDEFGDSVWESGTGSGFVVSAEDCLVWTNHHVIKDAAIIEVFPRRWDRASGIPATVVSATPRPDVAILKMQWCDGMPAARLGDSDALHPGAETYAVGNPLGRNPDSISRGIISHTLRYFHGPTPYLQTDAGINPGNSGGALFNRAGEVIGINTAIATTRRGGNTGIGYSVPINLVKAVAKQLREGPPSWGTAGINEIVSSLSPDEAEIFRVPDGNAGIIITETPGQGPSAGKLLAHDVIFEIDGVAISDVAQALRLISGYPPGNRLAFHLVRAGAVISVDVTLEEGWQAEETRVAEYFDGYLGMTLEMWGEREDEAGQIKTPVITKVQSLGPAHKAHIASSQQSLAIRGPFVSPYLLDVKTVTGVVLDGEYHPVEQISDLEGVTAVAVEADAPLLLEIEVWARSNPADPRAQLAEVGTVFFKLTPALTTAAAPSTSPAAMDPRVADASHPPASEVVSVASLNR